MKRPKQLELIGVDGTQPWVKSSLPSAGELIALVQLDKALGGGWQAPSLE